MHIKVIAKSLNLLVEGDTSLEITHVAPLSSPQTDSIIFIENPQKAQATLDQGRAFLLPEGCRDIVSCETGKAYLFSLTPRLSFIALLDLFNPYKNDSHQTQAISPEAKIHTSANIGPHSIIGPGVTIAARVVLKGNNYIGPGAIIKVDTVVEAGTVVLAGCEVGAHCYLGPNVSIGGEGFGYEKTEKGLIKIPQIGKVVLEDKVEVGANSCIDRATLGETRIGFNTKIDNLVQIGHNVKVGPHCIIVALVGIGGSTHIGQGVALGGQVGICDHSRIGEGSQIGAKSGTFSHQVLPPHSKVLGFPPMPHIQHMKIVSALKKLPELVKKSKKVEKLRG